MKWPCLAVKACQQHTYLIVLYIEKLLKHNINRMRGLIKPMVVFSPPCHGPPPFETLINRGPAGGTTFSMCTRVRIQEYTMMFYILYIFY